MEGEERKKGEKKLKKLMVESFTDLLQNNK